MSRAQLIPLWLALLAVAPAVAANPCAGACGDVTVVTTCATTTVTAEGHSTSTGTVWTLVITESDGGVARTHTESQAGPTATFYASFVHGTPYHLTVRLYADGALVDGESVACL